MHIVIWPFDVTCFDTTSMMMTLTRRTGHTFRITNARKSCVKFSLRQVLNQLLGKRSLKTSNFSQESYAFVETDGLSLLSLWDETPPLQRVRMTSKNQRQFVDTHANRCFSEKDSGIILQRKIHVAMKGTSTCSMARMTKALAVKRRVIPEA